MLELINKKRNKKGFTLVELIVVIAILGILIAIAVPRLTGFSDKAKKQQTLVNAKQLATAGDALMAEEKTYNNSKTGLGKADPGKFNNDDIFKLAGLEMGEDKDGTISNATGDHSSTNSFAFTYSDTKAKFKVTRNANGKFGDVESISETDNN